MSLPATFLDAWSKGSVEACAQLARPRRRTPVPSPIRSPLRDVRVLCPNNSRGLPDYRVLPPRSRSRVVRRWDITPGFPCPVFGAVALTLFSSSQVFLPRRHLRPPLSTCLTSPPKKPPRLLPRETWSRRPCNPSTTLSTRGCRPCLKYVLLPISPDWTNSVMAEGEKLGSNLLHVTQSSGTQADQVRFGDPPKLHSKPDRRKRL
jgi:hypothetical protein